MPIDVQVHAISKILRTDKDLDHTNDLGAFLVDGRRVEIIDFKIRFWLNRMGERSGIFGELPRSQHSYIADPFYPG